MISVSSYSLSVTPVIFFLWSCSGQLHATVPDSTRYSQVMAHSIMGRHPEMYGEWDYVTGTVLRAFQELYLVTGNQEYFDYVKKTVDAVVDAQGHISDYHLSDYNIDEIKEGCALLFLYRHTGQEKYRLAAGRLRQQMEEHPRTSEGGFWHKLRYPHQIWLDGLYMASPFLAEYGVLFNEPELFDDVVNQIVLADKYTYDTLKGIYYHGWDESRSQDWADPITGQSPSFWGRAMGWYAMAIVDVLDFLPHQHPGRSKVLEIFQRFTDGIISYQDSTGVWWQVMDQAGREGNYLESSVSSMFTYAMLKGIRLGYIDTTYHSSFSSAYRGIIDQFVINKADGSINLTQTCKSAGLGYGRDGSYDYYVFTATYRDNDGKGLGPFVLASLEMEESLYPPSLLRAESIGTDSILLTWRDNSNREKGFLLERRDEETIDFVLELPADQNSYTDRDFSPRNTYRYYLRAFDLSDTTVATASPLVTTLGANGEPGYAGEPYPADEKEGLPLEVLLEWKPGTGSRSHDLYFGTTLPPPFKANHSEPAYLVKDLDYQTTYFWRVDEVNDKGTSEGETWSFTTMPVPQVVGDWNFKALGTQMVEDQTGFQNHGIPIGMDETSWQEGIIGEGLYFNGIDQYVEVPHAAVLDFDTGNFSLSFWLRQDPETVDYSKEYRYLIKGSHNEEGGADHSGKRYEVFLNPASGQIRFSIDDNITKSVARSDMDLYITGNWVHVAAIRDRSEKVIKLFADGELQSTAADLTGDISQQESLFIGFCKDFGSYFQGYLDEVRIFNYALHPEEVTDLYMEGANVYSENPESTQRQLHIYPNPVGNTFYLVLPEYIQETVELVLYGQNGSALNRWKYSVSKKCSKVLMIDVPDLQPGLYLMQVITSAGISSCQILKQ